MKGAGITTFGLPHMYFVAHHFLPFCPLQQTEVGGDLSPDLSGGLFGGKGGYYVQQAQSQGSIRL